jgi:predicted transcriptional regulator
MRYRRSVASSRHLFVRLGPEGLRALDEIARRRRVSRSEAARQAIEEVARRERRRAGLAVEAAALMRDQSYVREAREVSLSRPRS